MPRVHDQWNCFSVLTKFTNGVIGDEAHRVSGNAVDNNVEYVDNDVDVEDDVGVKDDVDANDDDVEHGNGSAVIKLR